MRGTQPPHEGGNLIYAGINRPVQVSVIKQGYHSSWENVRHGSNCECVRVYIWGMKYVQNNGVNISLLVFELLDIPLIPLQRKYKTTAFIRWDGALDYNQP